MSLAEGQRSHYGSRCHPIVHEANVRAFLINLPKIYLGLPGSTGAVPVRPTPTNADIVSTQVSPIGALVRPNTPQHITYLDHPLTWRGVPCGREERRSPKPDIIGPQSFPSLHLFNPACPSYFLWLWQFFVPSSATLGKWERAN
jgi:hypothetical protein